MIRAIIFDLGGVLFTNGTNKFIDYLSKTYHLNKNIVQEVVDGQIGSNYRENKISRDEFWLLVLKRLGIKANISYLENKWIENYQLIEGTKKLILMLKPKYKIYFLSDNVKERVDRLEQEYHFIDWFDGGVFSHEVGIRKPNPEIYRLILKKIGISSSKCLYVDDKPKFSLQAKNLGFAVLVFNSPEIFKQDLINLGLLG